MPQFKTYEEKCLFELDQLENENAELKSEIEAQKTVIKSFEDREQKFKELLRLFNLHYYDCSTSDELAFDVDTVYPYDHENYAKVKELVEGLGIEIPNK